MQRSCVAIAASLALSACALNNTRDVPKSAPNTEVVAHYLAALNQRDLLGLTLYVTPDFEWYSVIDAQRTLEVSDREELKAMLTQFFAQSPRARWTLLNTSISGRYVAVVERSQWGEGDQAQARDTVGVYELESGRIRRVTYFLNGR